MEKLFKFWKYRLEIKLKRLSEKKKVEFLTNKLLKELNLKIDPDCDCVYIWIHNKKTINIEANGQKESECNYTGK